MFRNSNIFDNQSISRRHFIPIEKKGKNPSYKATYITKKEKNHTVITSNREQEKNKYHLTNGNISYGEHESKEKIFVLL